MQCRAGFIRADVEYTVHRWNDEVATRSDERMAPDVAARRIASFSTDPIAWSQLVRATWADLGCVTPTAAQLREAVVTLFASGRWKLVARPAVVIYSRIASAAEAEESPGPEPTRETAHIEIGVVDADQQPVPNAAYEITLADGSVRTGTLDGDGRARIDGIAPGTCMVAFPDFAPVEWRARY